MAKWLLLTYNRYYHSIITVSVYQLLKFCSNTTNIVLFVFVQLELMILRNHADVLISTFSLG
jgi:hypothetical protein